MTARSAESRPAAVTSAAAILSIAMSSMELLDANVLFVEPDEAFAASVRSALPTSRIEVERAANGTDAWMILATFKHQFDVVVIDLSLPDLDGLELLRKIRRSPKHRATSIVVCTARTHRDEVATAIHHGVRHYFVKPCPADAVARKILDLITVASTTPPAAVSV